jgi:hypothetical protein
MTDEWLTKCGIHIQWIGRKINREEIMTHAATWMNPKDMAVQQCEWTVPLKCALKKD